jgi:hypothetical protein
MSAESPRPTQFDAFIALLSRDPNANQMHYSVQGLNSMGTAFKNAANLMADAVMDTSPADCELIFPMLFCYRHFLELRVKEMVQCSEGRVGNPLEGNDIGHGIGKKLKQISKDFDEKQALEVYGIWGDGETETASACALGDWNWVEDWVNRFATMDPSGTRFRYPNATNGSEHPFPNLLQDLDVADAGELKQKMNGVDEAALSWIRLLSIVSKENVGHSE